MSADLCTRLGSSDEEVVNNERPELPPGWDWHPNYGDPKNFILYEAIGPQVGGHHLRAYGRMKDNQTPEAAASSAWELWSRVSGLDPDVYRKMLDDHQTMQEARGNWPDSPLIIHPLVKDFFY